jgi:hypothetical protein
MNDPIQRQDARPKFGRTPQAVATRRNRLCGACFYGMLLAVVAVCGALNAPTPQAAAQRADEKIVARVNGEPIYESELTRDIPDDSFADAAADMRKIRLKDLISQMELRQFLDAHKIVLTEQDVDKAIAYLTKFPPTMGCPCCRYPSLALFLKDNQLTLSEFRVDVKNDLRLRKYVDSLFDKTYASKQSRAALIATERKRTERDFTHAWQIFFNTFQRIDQRETPAAVSAHARAKAEAAWARLQKGEPFAQVARQTSEDQISRDKGGDLGFIMKEAYGKEFDRTLSQLKPGEISRPFASPYGYHIVKREPIKDEELLPICRTHFVEAKTSDLLDRITVSSKVENYIH